jgi:hypothetical protein
MLFNSSFNYISAILRLSVLLAGESAVPGENHQSTTSHWQTLSHNVVSSTPRPSRFELTMLVMIGTDYIGRCKLYFYLTLPAKPSDDSLGVVVSQK